MKRQARTVKQLLLLLFLFGLVFPQVVLGDPPTLEIQKLLATDPEATDYFGITAAIDGEYAIVGAREEDTAGNGAGAVYIYHRTGPDTWDGGIKVMAADLQAGDWFGNTVDIDGDYAVVGASGKDTGGNNAGAAYIFRRTGTNTWDGGTKLMAPVPQAEGAFGYDVAIHGDYVVIGSSGEDSAIANTGAAYVFRRTGVNTWDGGTRITAPDAEYNDFFGGFVAIDGDYVVVGAYPEDEGGTEAGAAYIFHRTGLNTWDGGTKVLATDPAPWDRFGQGASIGGDYVVVAAPYKDGETGAVYIFHRTGTNAWDSVTKIMAPDAQGGDRFGYSTDIDGDSVLIGAFWEDEGGANAGAAYIFRRTGTNTWDSGTKIMAADAQAGDWFGIEVSLDGDYAVIGGHGEDEGASDAGAAYIFARGIHVDAVSGDTGEDGTWATFTARLNKQPADDVTIGVSSSDTGEGTVDKSSLTFTNLNWNANQTVTITGMDDSLIDGNQNYNIVLDGAISSDSDFSGRNPDDLTVTNIDDDSAGFIVSAISGNTAEDGTTAAFTVKLTSEPKADVTIGVSSSDTGEGTVDKASLTFTNLDWDANQTVTVTGVDDDVADGNQALTVLLGVASSLDSDYDALNPSDISVINVDNDFPGFTVSPITANTTEEGGTGTFTVKLNSEPDNDVVIDVASSDTTEGIVSPAALIYTVGDWDANQIVTVAGVDDDVADGNQGYGIQLSINVAGTADTTGYAALDPPDVPVTNTDMGETAGFVVTTVTGNTDEDGTEATFTVRLTSEPIDDVIVDMVCSDTSEGMIAPDSLTLNAGNWNVEQTVTITGLDDTIVDGNQDFFVELVAALSNDDGYDGLDPADVSVINEDNDFPRSGSSGGCSIAASAAPGSVLDLSMLLALSLPFWLGIRRLIR